MSSARRRKSGAALAVAAALALAACAGGGDSLTAPALWYGYRADGSPTTGVTDVAVAATAAADSDAPFAVDLSGLDGETDAAWRATAWTAATQAMLVSGRDPRGRSLSIDVRESIGGPSAGAILAATSAVAVADGTTRQAVTATGTVLPDGGIGPVSGIPDKLRAAREAGITTVLVPQGQTTGTDIASGRNVDIASYASGVGVTVRPVASVYEVQAAIAAAVSPRPEADPGPLAPALTALAAEAATASLANLNSPTFAVAPAPDGLSPARASALEAALSDARTRGPQLLAAGEAMSAFVLTGTTERAIVAWNAGVTAATQAQREGVAATTARLRAVADEVRQQAIDRRRAAAATPTPTAESYPSLADALCWATDAIATARVTAAVLDGAGRGSAERGAAVPGAAALDPATPGAAGSGAAAPNAAVLDPVGAGSAVPDAAALDPAGLAAQAADLAQVEYDTRVFLPVAVAAATGAPGTAPPAPAEATAELDAYAGLLAESAAANTAFFAALGDSLGADAALPDSRLTDSLADQWDERPTGSDAPAALVRASIALAQYVSSTSLVVGAGSFAADTSTGDPAARVVAVDEAEFARRVGSATATADLQARLLTGAGRSAQYLLWSRAWGAEQATAPASGAAGDNVRREGLVNLWYATTSGRMLPTVR